MMNTMEIDGHKAVISYDPEIEMFRGEFVDLNGSADFYAANADDLKKEAAQSLEVYIEICKEKGIEPWPEKKYSGKFNLRVSKNLHKEIALAAKASGKSLNKWVADALGQAVAH